ncbi:MoaF-related domain-containing protein [Fluviicola sp.]|uniref:MoaF-related domain-containing protein n=1 Tax=Fluviicola sp. TaxID=1917219 RepID=UPI003D294ABB
MKKIGTLIILSGMFFTSCCCNDKQQDKKSTNEIANTKEFALIGKKGKITFPEMKVETTYLSDSTLHWKTTNNKGVINEGDESVSYEQLTGNLHFLNWVEKNGYVISLVINTKEGKVKAFWSYHDESARGKRSSAFTDGKFEFVK